MSTLSVGSWTSLSRSGRSEQERQEFFPLVDRCSEIRGCSTPLWPPKKYTGYENSALRFEMEHRFRILGWILSHNHFFRGLYTWPSSRYFGDGVLPAATPQLIALTAALRRRCEGRLRLSAENAALPYIPLDKNVSQSAGANATGLTEKGTDTRK
jgi:hypothetical protein